MHDCLQEYLAVLQCIACPVVTVHQSAWFSPSGILLVSPAQHPSHHIICDVCAGPRGRCRLTDVAPQARGRAPGLSLVSFVLH